MDKTTKAFVIAACSVVIATPVVWLGLEFLRGQRLEALRAEQHAQKLEKARRTLRAVPCYDKSKGFFDPNNQLILDSKVIEVQAEWISSCVESTVPVEEFD